jgi:hypothetical protein
VFDDPSLANLNPRHSLKLLHYYFDNGVRNTEEWDKTSQFIRIASRSLRISTAELLFQPVDQGLKLQEACGLWSIGPAVNHCV